MDLTFEQKPLDGRRHLRPNLLQHRQNLIFDILYRVFHESSDGLPAGVCDKPTLLVLQLTENALDPELTDEGVDVCLDVLNIVYGEALLGAALQVLGAETK